MAYYPALSKGSGPALHGRFTYGHARVKSWQILIHAIHSVLSETVTSDPKKAHIFRLVFSCYLLDSHQITGSKATHLSHSIMVAFVFWKHKAYHAQKKSLQSGN
ncbi:hypothetical protein VFPPC_17791 [Pochonia chlamydosporia 170]|uniref:Uncharacterized protein n=1 Tax=Pochonia chlamydosporia 170 TaxID=1380566 RepID=A0A219AQE7_METCM|nr:hypothetical protein VFPPC_17791 [Pochonia chlamydosporia 170]OWT43016.1 hypothetical protein VFPPC_17791 [Pochonia chlamydosporia 170]